MDIEFYKIFAAGSDVVLISCLQKQQLEKSILPHLAYSCLNRRKGIGGTALGVIYPSNDGIFELLSYFPSGEPAVNSYDCLAAAAKYGFNLGLAGSTKFTINTPAGPKEIIPIHGRTFQLNLGEPRSVRTAQVLKEDQNKVYTEELVLDHQSRAVFSLHITRPYAVIFHTQMRKDAQKQLAKALKEQPSFSNHTPCLTRVYSRDVIELNQFVSSRKRDSISAAAAAHTASVLAGFSDRTSQVIHSESSVISQWKQNNDLTIALNPQYSFKGQYYVDLSTIEEMN
jgi:diaminopimelate epimerase